MPGIAYRSAEPGDPSAIVRDPAADGTAIPSSGPPRPPAMIPIPGPNARLTDDRDHGPAAGRDQLAPSADQPDRQADHRRREDHVEPEASRIGDLAADGHAGQRGQVPRDPGRPDRGDPVAAFVGPADPREVADAERERLVGQDVRP